MWTFSSPKRRRSLLDSKITSILSWSVDHTVLLPVQRIILSTILYEDSSQQQLSFLQSEFRRMLILVVAWRSGSVVGLDQRS